MDRKPFLRKRNKVSIHIPTTDIKSHSQPLKSHATKYANIATKNIA